MSLYQRYLDWCFDCDTRPYVERLARIGNLRTRIKGRLNGKRYDLAIHADILDEMRRQRREARA